MCVIFKRTHQENYILHYYEANTVGEYLKIKNAMKLVHEFVTKII